MHTKRSFTALCRIVAGFALAVTAAACDDGAEQGAVGTAPEARKLDITGNIALYEVAVDDEIRLVQIIEPLDELAFRILDGDRLVVEVIDGEHGPSDELICDAASEAVAEFVLDGGLTASADEAAEFRRMIDNVSGKCVSDCHAGCGDDNPCLEWCVNSACS